ncbi:MAG TPA: hypothetical protein VKU00_23550 [Chthonomonadaceae bacterium]|nr:hypothetical protein [Chthonomonadaceae bacterium]
MPLPDFDADDFLPPGIHASTLKEVETRFGIETEVRQQRFALLQAVVTAARPYPTIKRILVWGSFVTSKPEPQDLDYSLIVSVDHLRSQIAPEDARFFVPSQARIFYGVDRGYLVIKDYPLEEYIERLAFMGRTRSLRDCGIVEISVRGEFLGDNP